MRRLIGGSARRTYHCWKSHVAAHLFLSPSLCSEINCQEYKEGKILKTKRIFCTEKKKTILKPYIIPLVHACV